MISLLNRIDEQLIENIRGGMSRRNWKPAELARRTGLTPMKVSRVLNSAQWDSDVLGRIAEAFGCAAADLLSERERTVPEPDSALVNRMALFELIPKIHDNDIPLILACARGAIESRPKPKPVKKNKHTS